MEQEDNLVWAASGIKYRTEVRVHRYHHSQHHAVTMVAAGGQMGTTIRTTYGEAMALATWLAS